MTQRTITPVEDLPPALREKMAAKLDRAVLERLKDEGKTLLPNDPAEIEKVFSRTGRLMVFAYKLGALDSLHGRHYDPETDTIKERDR